MFAAGTSKTVHSSTAVPTRFSSAIPLALAVATLIILFSAISASATLSVGSVTGQTTLSNCPTPNTQWLSFTTSDHMTHDMHCVAAEVTGCPNEVQDISFTYGYLNPAGIAPGITASNVQGLIVFFDGSAGTTPAAEEAEYDMLHYYFTQGYEIVQVAWNFAWESRLNPWPYSTSPLGNIQNSACRPATFLYYVDTADASYGLFKAVVAGNVRAGMCAQGFSAGSAQIGYSLAYYGAGAYLDNVELISGPEFSDLMQGCQEGPQASPVTVCPLDSKGNPQYGCRLDPNPPYPSWMISPTFVPGQNHEVADWTDDGSCALAGSTSSPASLTAWLNQSIVDKSTGLAGQGAVPTFTYSDTGMSGWLCRTVSNPNINCSTNYQYQYCPNNTSPQGQIFYQNITLANTPPVFNVYAVDGCVNPEGAPQGTVAANGLSGQKAIQQDMAGLQGFAPGACTHRMR